MRRLVVHLSLIAALIGIAGCEAKKPPPACQTCRQRRSLRRSRSRRGKPTENDAGGCRSFIEASGRGAGQTRVTRCFVITEIHRPKNKPTSRRRIRQRKLRFAPSGSPC